MKVALGQFAVSREWQENAETCVSLMKQAAAGGADLLVLPEGILARDIADPDIVLKTAQPLDGPFMTRVLEAIQAGVNDYLVKPFTTENLREKLSRFTPVA